MTAETITLLTTITALGLALMWALHRHNETNRTITRLHHRIQREQTERQRITNHAHEQAEARRTEALRKMYDLETEIRRLTDHNNRLELELNRVDNGRSVDLTEALELLRIHEQLPFSDLATACRPGLPWTGFAEALGRAMFVTGNITITDTGQLRLLHPAGRWDTQQVPIVPTDTDPIDVVAAEVAAYLNQAAVEAA
ncbi:MAG: hypothetical protein AAF467_27720 [Actinomycetota bacterium]